MHGATTRRPRSSQQAPPLIVGGVVAHGFEVRVVNDQDIDVQVGEVGEVICRGPALMDGYLGDEEATAAALRGGWMHTGDLGKLDDEGYLYITDRKKDMIISGGENIYPREVEDVLFSHEAVHSAAVIGIPDKRWGEQVHAIVVRTLTPQFKRWTYLFTLVRTSPVIKFPNLWNLLKSSRKCNRKSS